MDRSTRGTLEVVGIATAAAAAIGGIVVALSRAQSAQNSDGESPNAVASVSSVTSNGGDRGSDAMAPAMGSLAEVYPEILDSIRNLLTNAGEAARPAVDRAATSFPSATDVRATGASAISKLQHAALDTIVPAMSEVFQSARGRLELDHEPAEPAKSAEPAVGDIDNDGKLELIASNSKLYVWDLNNSSDLADWPVFKKNASRTSANQEPGLIVTPDCATYMAQIGSSTPVVAYLNLTNSGLGSFDWQASITPATGITMLPTSGTIISENTVQVRINPAGLSVGMHEFVVTIEGSTDGRVVSGSPVQVVVQVLVVNNLYKTFVPMIPNN